MQQLKKTARALVYRGLPSDIRDTVVVSGSPRSGTTWLAELLLTLPEYRLLDEPLHLGSGRAREAGVDEWRTYVPPDAEQPALEDFLRRALSAQIPGRYVVEPEQGFLLRLQAQLLRKPLVVKFVRASRMLHWLRRQFAVRGLIHILRHPCAVVASQLTYETSEWRDTQPPDADKLQGSFGGWIPKDLLDRFRSTLAGIRTTAGHLAAVWCLDNYVPLYYEADDFPGLVISYEALVDHEKDEIERICNYLDAPVPTQVAQRVEEPSHSASEDLATQDKEQQLSKWKRKLSTDQIDEVLGVVEEFSLDFYTEALEPDRKRLGALTESHLSSSVASPAHEKRS